MGQNLYGLDTCLNLAIAILCQGIQVLKVSIPVLNEISKYKNLDTRLNIKTAILKFLIPVSISRLQS